MWVRTMTTLSGWLAAFPAGAAGGRGRGSSGAWMHSWQSAALATSWPRVPVCSLNSPPCAHLVPLSLSLSSWDTFSYLVKDYALFRHDTTLHTYFLLVHSPVRCWNDWQLWFRLWILLIRLVEIVIVPRVANIQFEMSMSNWSYIN